MTFAWRRTPVLFTLLTICGSAAEPTIDKFGASHVVGFELAADQTAVAALAQQAGVRWDREDFSWHLMEPSEGVYSFSNQDTFVNNAVAAGLTILGGLQYTPDFYSEQQGAGGSIFFPTVSGPGLTAWENFVTAVVNRYKDRIHTWQIWPNLEDTEFWKGGQGPAGMAKYKDLLDRAYDAIKAEDPTATVLVASIDPDNLNALIDLGSGGSFDAIGVHNYTDDLPESSTLLQLRLDALRDVSQRRLGGRPLFTSEYGWHTSATVNGVSQSTQAAYLIRSMLLQGAFADVDGVVWVNHKDTDATGGGCEASQPADNDGMLLLCGDSNTKKSSYGAYQAMTTALGGAEFQQTIEHSSSVQVIEDFEGGTTYSVFGGSIAFAFDSTVSHGGAQSGKITFTRDDADTPKTVVPNPTFFKNVGGNPGRFCVWARGDGGPAAELTVSIRDNTNETFQAVLGLIRGTAWRRHCFYLDAPVQANALMSPKPGDGVVNYPIDWGGFGVTGWSVATPVTGGVIWLDDAVFESGPSIVHQRFSANEVSTHALWSLAGSTSVDVAVSCPGAVVRDWTNSTSNLAASSGVVTVAVDQHPVFVSENCASPQDRDSGGVFRPSNGVIFLRNDNTNGIADVSIVFGVPGDKPIAGDWDGDGDDSIGVYRDGTFYLRNTNETGFSDLTFGFGTSGDKPVAGDWDGDGTDTIGLFRDGLFFLRNANNSGPAEIAFSLGVAGDVPIAGDWNGDGVDTVGVFRPSNGALFLKNQNSSGFADIMLTYGLPGDKPVVGDWNDDGSDSIGVYRGDLFLLRNSNTNGFADIVFSLGVAGDEPIAGDWDGLP